MDGMVVTLLKWLVLVPITLLPIINPLGIAPIFAAKVGGNRTAARRLARQVAVNSWLLLVGSMLFGTYVLQFFGISIPVIRIGGGLLVAATGWRMLNSSEDDEVRLASLEHASTLSDQELLRQGFFPMTFPLTTGPGTIAASIALSAQFPSKPVLFLTGAIVAAAGAALVSLVLYLVYKNSAVVLTKLGEIGTLVMMKLMAFILMCVGLQIMWTGWAELNGIAAT